MVDGRWYVVCSRWYGSNGGCGDATGMQKPINSLDPPVEDGTAVFAVTFSFEIGVVVGRI